MGAMSATEILSTCPSLPLVPVRKKKITEPMQPDWLNSDGSLGDIQKVPTQHFSNAEYTESNLLEEAGSHSLPLYSKTLGQALLLSLGWVVVTQPVSLSTKDFLNSRRSETVFFPQKGAEINSGSYFGTKSGSMFQLASPSVTTQVYEVEEQSQEPRSVTTDFIESDVVRLARAQFSQLQTYENGWHGPRSLGADKRSFARAMQFLKLISGSEVLINVHPTIFSLGTAALEIETENAAMLLEFQADGTVLANVNFADEEYDYDITDFSGTGLPIELARYF